ncbi:hypothetical protein [Marinobacterium lacunae]|uniref:hypothetical protein n=1 Tax=Marinobacterium lacunae TaxID=1232683 RepID=UPI00055A6394|nr:hypothetical protein [Marinobacterium lacunae]
MTYADENGFSERDDDESYIVTSRYPVTDHFSDICQCDSLSLKYNGEFVELESIYFVNDEEGGIYWGTVCGIDPPFGQCNNELGLETGDEISFEEYHVFTCNLKDA